MYFRDRFSAVSSNVHVGLRFIQTTHMTVGSLTTHTTAQSVVPLRHPFPRVLGVPKEACLCEPLRTGARQGPTAASSCQRSCPAAAAGLRTAGTGNGQREGWLEPRTSPDNVLRKHEGCDEESARWRVQGALDQAGRRRAAASGCATQGELAGRTC